MPTIKLVVIGSSGVGKTSLRGKYISGRFSAGYRATIGADFITKTLPHPTDATQTITLQIWDTAGQERFSSLSTAFFRGADAALLMFDVNDPTTMHAMKKWWADFCDKAPVADEHATEYCCVVVGNKIDMAVDSGALGVSESEALGFLDELMPPHGEDEVVNVLPPEASLTPNGHIQVEEPTQPGIIPKPVSIHRPITKFTHSREPSHSPKHNLSKSRSRSSSRFYAGTMTSTHTGLTIYHTPSSSVLDARSSVYHSARSSPEPWSRSEPDLSQQCSPASVRRRRALTVLSIGSTSSESGATITPSLLAREREQNPNDLPSSHSSPDLMLQSKYRAPLPPERGPRLFFTSAKTGEGVNEVFEYIAHRVVRKWEYDDWVDARQMHFRESTLSGGATLYGSWSSENIRLGGPQGRGGACCSR